MSLKDDLNEVGNDIKGVKRDLGYVAQEFSKNFKQPNFKKFLSALLVALTAIFLAIIWLIVQIITFRFIKWYLPKTFKECFEYRFRDLFFNKQYWRDVYEALFLGEGDPETPYWRWFFILSLVPVFSPAISLICFGIAYRNQGLMSKRVYPFLNGHSRKTYAAMLFGLLLPLYLLIFYTSILLVIGLGHALNKDIWGVVKAIFTLDIFWSGLLKPLFNILFQYLGTFIGLLLAYLPIYILGMYLTFSLIRVFFNKWRNGINMYIFETARFGTAHFATPEELQTSVDAGDLAKGFYVGGGTYYNKSGHLLTVAGTRGGKGTNLIIPNLTKVGRFDGSFVVIDPKGENAAVTARIQKEQLGRDVVVLNPWNLLIEDYPHLKNCGYNPLDILTDKNDYNFIDDAQMIAEMIVPFNKESRDPFWDDRARSVICGLIIHLADVEPAERRHLGTLYEYTRLPVPKFLKLLEDMAASEMDAIRATANELLSIMQSEKTYSSILSSVHSHTDFLKSAPLQKSLQKSDFDPKQLVNGKTTLYVIIPADKLKTQYKWLRLVVTTLMRSVIRHPDKDVCFLLDEFFALDYISEIEVALAAYAGYGVHVWAILQNLIQLQDLYGENWESFISSCSVRHFFNISDNFSSTYLSQMFGQESMPTYDILNNVTGATSRNLVNPDELRIGSGDTMFAVIDHLAPATIPKHSYLNMQELVRGADYDDNPYHKKKQ